MPSWRRQPGKRSASSSSPRTTTMASYVPFTRSPSLDGARTLVRPNPAVKWGERAGRGLGQRRPDWGSSGIASDELAELVELQIEALGPPEGEAARVVRAWKGTGQRGGAVRQVQHSPPSGSPR